MIVAEPIVLRYALVSADYFLEIESHFVNRRGTPFIFNAKDWALMQEWAGDGIPLPVIIEAIDAVFDKASERGKVVNGLRYCRHAVKELWKARRELQVGADSTTPEADPQPLLETLAAALESTEARSFAPRVRDLGSEKSVPRIEERLIDLEHELAAALATEEIRAEAARAAEGNVRAEEAHVRRLVRERFGLPRLTLF